ncbi:MAG TPA: ubiquitin-conjugating enzyme E2 [Candidatus Norongarragalinales archaeon]|jgi:ubiquitin-protein ligase|nr:ubiquitin-conjugating enzyme E2 [Candidatus Norongarragalinales archaeon]
MQLPDAIYQRRLESELEEMRKSGEKFSATTDKTEYVVQLSAPGLQKTGNAITQRQEHQVRIRLKRAYPYPGGLEVTWLTPIFHPNIRPDGVVCIQLINKWSAAQTVTSVVKALRQLLENPNPASPLNLDAAEWLKRNPRGIADAPQVPRKPRIVS